MKTEAGPGNSNGRSRGGVCLWMEAGTELASSSVGRHSSRSAVLPNLRAFEYALARSRIISDGASARLYSYTRGTSKGSCRSSQGVRCEYVPTDAVIAPHLHLETLLILGEEPRFHSPNLMNAQSRMLCHKKSCSSDPPSLKHEIFFSTSVTACFL